MQIKKKLFPLYQSKELSMLTGVPEGFDVFVFLKLLEEAKRPLLHICLDESRMRGLYKLIKMFRPRQEVILFPAWDTLPYDRNSPNEHISEERILAYEAFLNLSSDSRVIILTTLNATLQKLPPKEALSKQVFSLKKGEELDINALQNYLHSHGYERTNIVRERGEYSIRGGIIDLFTSGASKPARLDLFGDEIESIRFFDPISQKSEEEINSLILKSAREIILNDESIKNFRTAYRKHFGLPQKFDLLYESISEGRIFPGMEHWLPFFYGGLVTLSSYLPDDILITYDDQLVEAKKARLEQIKDFYEARLEMRDVELANAKKAKKDPQHFYNPIPPELMFLSEVECDHCFLSRGKKLVPFSHMGMEGDCGAKVGKEFIEERARQDVNIFDAFLDYIEPFRVRKKQIILACYSKGSAERLKYLLENHAPNEKFFICPIAEAGRYHDLILLCEFPLARGFVYEDTLLITEQDLLGERMIHKVRKKKKSDAFINEISTLHQGDLVVHMDHGLGKFDGLVTLTIEGAPHDCIKILYAGEDKLFLPVEQIELLSQYGESTTAQLDKLGGGAWEARKKKVKKRLKDMADALLKIAAERAIKKADVITPPLGLYEEFVARFPHEPTEDQQKAIANIIDDLASGHPMDRLICGDVGFGKTEVAMHAAFLAAMSGIQVALIVPTTLLARQHYQNFKKRFEGMPLKIEMLSRLVSPKKITSIKKGIQSGDVNIVIGTHALLSDGIDFMHLGMCIIDEEQRFGVKQKEKLKKLRSNMHVLTLTATPIPRTLQLSLTGVRELSLIGTPPIDRLAVRSFIMPFDPIVIREAIMREFYRGGQIYYVCPRIKDLEELYKKLKELVPEVKIVKAHGSLSSKELENVMEAFDGGKFHLLLATTIVESGLDVTNANTMIIHRSDLFGLAQLYQLRGRIGRGKVRGYAYLTYEGQKPLAPIAKKRLEIIETLDTLGAGFNLASHDMELRGAGNILGEEQSGQIKEVGVELYQKMLEETIAELKSSKTKEMGSSAGIEEEEGWTPQINLGAAVQIPEDYVEDLGLRLSLYRRIASLQEKEELDAFSVEIMDRFGPMPASFQNLLNIIEMKALCKKNGIEKIDAGPKGALIKFYKDQFKSPEKLLNYINQGRGRVKLKPDQQLLIIQDWAALSTRIEGVSQLLEDLKKMLH